MDQTHRTRRHQIGTARRPDQAGCHIGPGPPFSGHRQIDQRFPVHGHKPHVHHAVGQHRDQGHAGPLWHNAQLRRVPSAIAVAVQCHGQHIGRVACAIGGKPARAERGRGAGIFPIRLGHTYFMCPPRHGCTNADRVRARLRDTLGDAHPFGDRFPIPTAIDAEPLIAGFNPINLPVQRSRSRPPIGGQQQQIKPCLGILRQGPVESRTNADNRSGGAQGARQIAFDRARCAIAQDDGNGRLIGTVVQGKTVQRQCYRKRPRGIGLRGCLQRPAQRVNALIMATKAETRPVGQRLCAAQRHIARD